MGAQEQAEQKLSMSRKERSRLEVLSRVKGGEITLARAAGLLGVSERQAWRVYRRYRDEGDAGLVDRLGGKAWKRGTGAAARDAVVALYRAKYGGFGPTLAAEKL